MADYTGSILELNEKKAIVMTDTCDFVSIRRKPEMFVGQQISFKKSEMSGSKINYPRYIALLASVFILALCSIFYLQIFNPATVFAYIDVDINPSLEFSIDKNANVLSTKPLNADAKQLIKGLKLNDMPVKQAIASVIEASENQGYINKNKENAILISASIKESKKASQSNEAVLDNILTDLKTATVSSKEDLQTEIIKVTPESRDKAVKNKISMGRYSLYSEIKKQDDQITVEKAKNDRVSDMIKKAKVNNKTKEKEKNNNGKSPGNPKKPSIKNDKETFKADSGGGKASDANLNNKDSNNKNKVKNDNTKNNKDTKSSNDKNKISSSITVSPDEKDSFDQGSVSNSTKVSEESASNKITGNSQQNNAKSSSNVNNKNSENKGNQKGKK